MGSYRTFGTSNALMTCTQCAALAGPPSSPSWPSPSSASTRVAFSSVPSSTAAVTCSGSSLHLTCYMQPSEQSKASNRQETINAWPIIKEQRGRS